ncbi:MAG TPA: PAS domain S-box protein [Stellaceae bacterium]|nr:PAS domain S-box protein [Stellaceae bacterium]
MDWVSHVSLAFHLLNNAAFLAAGTLGYCELRRHVEKRLPRSAQALLYGIVFGILGILTSHAPAITAGGYGGSLAFATIIVATLLCGVASGAVATLLLIADSAFIRGADPALWLSVCTAIPFLIAAGYRRLVRFSGMGPLPTDFAIVALASVIGVLAPIAWRLGASVFATIFLPAIPAWASMFVLTTVALGAIVWNVERSRALARMVAENERRFRGFYNETPVMLTAVDQSGCIAAVSDRWLEAMGYRRDEVIGHSRYEFLAPASAAYMRERVLPALQTDRRLSQVALQLRRKDGAFVEVIATLILRRDPATGVEETLTFAEDQTERRRAEVALRESRQLLLEAQRLGRVGHILSDLANDRVYWSDSLFELRKTPRRDFFTFAETLEFLAPEDRDAYMRVRNDAVAAHRDFETEIRVRRGDGSIAWEHSFGHPRYDHAGNCIGVLVVLRDITESKLADEALRRKEAELSAIMDNAPMTIFLKDREGRYRLVNRSYCEWVGRSPEEVCGRTAADIFPRDMAAAMAARDKEVLERGEVAVAEVSTQLGDRKCAGDHALVTKFPVRDAADAIVGLAGFTTDITARKRAETALRETQRQLQTLMDNAPFAIFLKDRAGRFALINRTYTDWFDERPEDVVGRTTAELYPPEWAQQWEAADRELIKTGQIFREERRTFKTRPGLDIDYVLTTKFPIRDEHGATVGFAGIVEDITARKKAEEALRHSEERFRALIEHSADMVTVIARDGRITYRSPSSLEVTGHPAEDVLGRPIFDLVHPNEVDALRSAVMPLAGQPWARAAGRTRVRHRDGSWRTLAWSARDASDVPGIDGIIINSRDVTQALQLEEQLRESQKMEAVGQLAGGIAHDFNNLLGAILGFAGFLLQDLSQEAPEHRFADRIVTAAERGREIVRQLMTFSRRGTAERQSTDLALAIRETRDLLLASLPSSTRLLLSGDDDGLVANVNAAQITQVLLNLCLNANDALRGEPGEIAIELSRIEAADADPTSMYTPAVVPVGKPARTAVGRLRPGCAYARLVVEDTGVGMAPDVLTRIFDPFFTTKARGRGTGLGLSVVHGIVMDHGGALLVTSRAGIGSTFTVYLPLAEQRHESTRRELPAAAAVRGRERVLVVDDEATMKEALSIGLKRLGYETVGVNNAEEAIAAIIKDPPAWRVVVSDEVMPGMKGLALFQRLKEIRPSLRFILCTGFGDGTTEKTALAVGVDAFFVKPVSPEEIASAIRRVMDAVGAASV